MPVSVIDPINPAIERVKTVLFSPFDLGRWLTIAFCAWLAQMGRYNGGSGGGHPGEGRPTPAEEVNRVKDYVLANLDWIVPLGIVALALGIGIALLLVWLSSRGRFMFLDCVARNQAHVREPWVRFGNHAASLFAFRVVVGIIAAGILLTLGIAGGVLAWISHVSGFDAVSVLGLVSLGLVFAVVTILFLIVGLFTTDFVVPIMYLHAVNCTQAWRMLLDLTSWNQGRFILYLLFQIVLKIAIGVLVFGATCMTCCFACCIWILLALPYVGTAILLPIRVFERSYSAYYLSQYGPQFNVFTPPVPATPPMTP
jgi:hypothetical protein